MNTSNIKLRALALTAALWCALSAAGCADEIEVGLPVDEGAYQGVTETTLDLRDANTSAKAVDVEFSEGEFSTAVRISFTRMPEAPVRIEMGVDPDYLTAYNARHGTAYLSYPASLVRFENEGQITVEPARSAQIGMRVSASAELKTGKTYAIPVTVTVWGERMAVKTEASHCLYLIEAREELPTCHKGDDLPKGYLFFEVNDTNPLNALAFELEDGRLLWDVVVLFAANINHNVDEDRPYVQCNPNVQFLLDNNETYLQPLRKRGIKVLLGFLGNHDQAGLAQLSDQGARDFAAEVARYCEAYNLDGVNYDDEYSNSPDLTHPAYTRYGREAAARLCYETKRAMPDKLVTLYDYRMMYGVSSVDGVDADEWIDIVVPDYGRRAYPIGNMTNRKCSYMGMEFRKGTGGSLTSSVAQAMLTGGYGWFMGFAPIPNQLGYPSFEDSFDRLKGGPEALYGSPLKAPTFYYRKNDPTRYPYPF